MLPRNDLARMMQGAMRAVERRGRYFPPDGEPDFFSYYEGARSAEERSEVIADVLYSGHPELAQRLFDQIAGSRREEGLLEILGTMAVVGHPAGVDHALGYLDSADEAVRAAAACALLSLADPRAVEGLQKRFRRERIDKVKQKILAALGACGADDPKVASLLLRQAGSGASILRIHALLALRHFPEEEKVRSSLLTAYRKEKNHEVKSAATIVLGFLRVADAVPYLEQDLVGVGETVLANHIRWALGCIRGTEDPELGWDDRMKSVSREGWE
jgi:HEAT repeat protein